MPRAVLTLKARALACVAQREHSRAELRRKLLAHVDRQRRLAVDRGEAPLPIEPADAEREVDELLDWLIAKDLLNSSRFVETRVRARASRFGNLRIRQELARHDVEIDDATAADLRRSEVARARAVWARRYGTVAADAAERARQMRFLAARGFGADAVRRVVGGDSDDES